MSKYLSITRMVKPAFVGLTLTFLSTQTFAQTKTEQQAEQTMLNATKFMVENVSTNGGYVWYYLPDLSRRWGEMEAYKTMVWIQDGGTVSVGHMLLDAYRATGNEYYYQAAEKAATALIWGQSNEGGWNYMIDFAGDQSLKTWYNTIGKNGWRLEEFQHYYGNDTYDDDVSSDAARFLLRMYLEKLDPKYRPALDKAINFMLKSQYPIGAWPQRYPLRYDFNKSGHPDYTSFYTFNDDVIWENTNFLIQCYQTLGEERLLDPITRGMNFYLLSQSGDGAWGQQYNDKLEVMGARTYEPDAYLPKYTYGNAMLLLKFYQYTGDRRFLNQVPNAIAWLEKTKLPADKTQNGFFTHSTFVDVKTNQPIYVHRKGSNVIYGKYYVDTNDQNTLGHYRGKTIVDIKKLKDEYARLSAMSVAEVTKDSPIKPAKFEHDATPQHYYDLNRDAAKNPVGEAEAKQIISGLDSKGRWLVKHVPTSNPYIGDGTNQEETTKYATDHVGDKTDTSPYRDSTDQEYISTIQYIRNMNALIRYVRDSKKK
ncbi:PelA/Pel-15E family pectate lyase [Mucilaginibacter yixingensis]|uniref:PelA/Pel-15E family pectate lyase n=1 Tax=Mucilaginibacter yixingensis TaxID=1295612 RepID=A0A2T5JAW3_9SPHI|nr:pectate lyase [Mucilaginibacter yixingensis]PTQ97919.1 PelA/Pel-15E family pectate lyase [Mucilaginibacter yixingensis]